MLNRFISGTSHFARRKASQSAALAVFVRDTISGFVTTAHHTLMLLGIAAIAAWGILFIKPELADRIQALSPYAAEPEASTAPVQTAEMTSTQQPSAPQSSNTALPAPSAKAGDRKLTESERQQQWVTNWLSKRYRVAADATDMLVAAAYATAKEIKLDPLLILSVMAIESRFNPFAESPVGAQGLMQVMSKVHRDKFEDHGGVKAALNPVANIKVGSMILKDYVTRGGSVEAGLKMYVGAAGMESDFGYGSKVLAEYRRLKDVSMGKQVPIYATTVVAKPRAPETKAGDAAESASVGATTVKPAANDTPEQEPLKNEQIAAL
ncbi:lytic transglycosylase domain-containing protein [Noviherbaspirillum sp.]|uniref:lytic transglycosylase domain-containing protein n=1 Tax=Noviherbaspirillum sp. TaxID=1926288 RepID=UPI002FDF0E28